MKITFNQLKSTTSNFNINFGKKILSIFSAEKLIEINVNTIKLFLEGEFYYSVNKKNPQKITHSNLKNTIIELVHNFGIENLTKYLEGSYLCCWLDQSNLKAGFFGDASNQIKAYYIQKNGDIEISSDLNDLVSSSRGYDQLSLYSFLLLGYPADNDTFYSGVKKLGCDEYFLFADEEAKKSKKKLSPKKIEKFKKNDLNHYDDLFTNAVSSRAGENNYVMNSGGWDSTSILYKLTELKPKKTVTAAVFDVVLSDGQSFNSYEVDRVNRIGSFFNVKTEKVTINYSDKSLIDYWESQATNMRNNHTYFWLHHLKISDMISSNAKDGTRVFNGECSDSIHNFGFSQFVSVNYDNMQLREIADKAKSYLYSPSFFKSISSNIFSEDKILNFFHNYYGKEKFVDATALDTAARSLSYFESFMLSYQRVPFARWQMKEVAELKLQEDFAQYMKTEYFSDIVEQSQPDTLYFWLLQLYRRFHFNSYQIGVSQVAMKSHNTHCVMPFLDSQLLDYMYRMPENWGRGLELRTTKYPLRFLAEHKWNMPLDILMEEGPHSYIAEADNRWSYAGGSWNIYCEIMYKSVFTNYFKSLFSRVKLEDVFDPAFFNVEYLRSIVKNYCNGKENLNDVTILFRLAILFSIGFLN